MKNRLIGFIFLVITTTACQKNLYDDTVANIPGTIAVNTAHPMKDTLTSIVNRHVAKGVPGIQVMVKSPAGWYVVNGGYARIEDKTPMQDNMVAWLYSLTKTYTAALTMKLKERGLVALDTPITTYLPADITQKLVNSDKITVRMLLNHSSGFPNFTSLPAFQLRQFNNPFDQQPLLEQLKTAYHKKPRFEPGTDYLYSNTNYLLLQLIIEKRSGKTYDQFLKEEILHPLALNKTYYGLTNQQIRTLGFPNYYFERYNNGQLENITQWNNAIGKSIEGYGGIAANGTDAIRFLEALNAGKVVNQTSLNEMRTWIKGKESTVPDYGLGLEYFEYNKGVPTYGHEGDNIGATTQLIYVPASDTYLFISINAGRQIFGQYLFRTTDAKIDLCRFVSKLN
jgi:D-alanyl-D-alanine carboxypeptidase